MRNTDNYHLCHVTTKSLLDRVVAPPGREPKVLQVVHLGGDLANDLVHVLLLLLLFVDAVGVLPVGVGVTVGVAVFAVQVDLWGARVVKVDLEY